MNYDEYLENDRELFESTLMPPDRLWLVLYPSLKLWSTPTEDRHEAEQTYYSALDNQEEAILGYVYDITGSMPYKEVERNFKEVRI